MAAEAFLAQLAAPRWSPKTVCVEADVEGPCYQEGLGLLAEEFQKCEDRLSIYLFYLSTFYLSYLSFLAPAEAQYRNLEKSCKLKRSRHRIWRGTLQWACHFHRQTCRHTHVYLSKNFCKLGRCWKASVPALLTHTWTLTVGYLRLLTCTCVPTLILALADLYLDTCTCSLTLGYLHLHIHTWMHLTFCAHTTFARQPIFQLTPTTFPLYT